MPTIKFHDGRAMEWDAYRKLDWERAGNSMARKLVVDGRNLYSPSRMRALGFEYVSFGRE